jgi:hypothetical protein
MSQHQEEAVPRFVLVIVARKYAEIQDKYPEHLGTKFIRRGDVRDSILAALIRDELNRQNLGRKKEIIADLMDLKKNGFSGGENTLRVIESHNMLYLSADNSTEGFAERYLERLGINTPDNLGFVCNVIRYLIAYNISPRSQLSSKVAGVIWLLINSRRLSVKIEDLENASDKTRGTTIKGIYKEISKSHLTKLTPVYALYGITFPHIV